MKKFIWILSACFLLSCNNQQNQSNQQAGSVPDSAKTPTEIQKDVNSSSLKFMNDWKGKTAREAGIFDNSLLDNRIIKILGEQEYTEMKNNWNVQTPFIEEDGILSASGCKQHDCPSFHSIIYVDVDNNNINIEIIKGANFKLFTEKGIITLPPQMQKDLDITKKNI